jgi:hypothetical protein
LIESLGFQNIKKTEKGIELEVGSGEYVFEY